MALKPSVFFVFHIYVAFIYFITFIVKSNSLDGDGLIFTLLITSPFLLAINRGLPLDCLNYETAVRREIGGQDD